MGRGATRVGPTRFEALDLDLVTMFVGATEEFVELQGALNSLGSVRTKEPEFDPELRSRLRQNP